MLVLSWGKERKEKERKGKGREGKGREGTGREGKGNLKEGKQRERGERGFAAGLMGPATQSLEHPSFTHWALSNSNQW